VVCIGVGETRHHARPIRAERGSDRRHENYRGRIGQSAEDAVEIDGDDVIERCGTAGVPLSPEQVATALIDKGIMLGQLGRSEEAIRVYEDVVQRFGAASGFRLRELVAKALFNECVMLGQLGQTGDEIAVYGDLIGRFGGASESIPRELVARALFNKGIRLGQLGRNEEAHDTSRR
jgi:tetratricopeptide (TPR) repeat protein